jgi:hypothetical protein
MPAHAVAQASAAVDAVATSLVTELLRDSSATVGHLGLGFDYMGRLHMTTVLV